VSWAKIDDGYDCNPKVLSVAVPARWLHLASITYCRRLRRQDGHMIHAEVAMLVASQRVPKRCVQDLLDVGLWDATDTGVAVHHYSAYLPDVSTPRTAAFRERSGNAEGTVLERSGNVPRAHGLPIPIPKPIPIPSNGAKAPSPSKASPTFTEEVGRVFEAWVGAITAQYGSSDHKLTPERTEKIRARLAQGYSVEILLDAVVGWRRDAWHVEHHEFKLTTLLRNGEQVEKFAELERRVQPVMPKLKALVQGRGPSEFRPISYEDAFDSATEAVN
jgi:hypothetical protein